MERNKIKKEYNEKIKKLVQLNKLKITSFFVNFSKLLMESLGIKPAEKM